MKKHELKAYLQRVVSGEISIDEAADLLRASPYLDMGFAKLDTHRELRQGAAEVIYGAGKTPQQIEGIIRKMIEVGQDTILITRISQQTVDALASAGIKLDHRAEARIAVVGEMPEPDGYGEIAVVTGGTSDIPVAEEAAVTAEALGNVVNRLYDIGVAGLHRMLANIDVISRARAIVAIAGMEGALASVIGGIADCPVIAVPTSIGYGASFGGLAALLSMLNSCASGVSVVNIDNGFGAGYIASMINHIGGTGR